MNKVFIDAPRQVKKFRLSSQGLRAGNTIYVSGMVAMDANGNLVGKGDMKAQAVQVYENIKAVLEAANSSLSDIVRLDQYIINLADLPKLLEVRERYLHHRTTSIVLTVKNIADNPDYLVAAEVIAVVD